MNGRAGVLTAAIGVAVSAVFLWLAARAIDWSATLRALQHVRLVWMAVGVAASLATFGASALRWQMLLGPVRHLPLDEMFDYTMIGQIAGLVLPQRLGDVVKIVVLGRRARVSGTTVSATVLIERVSDALMLILLGVLLLPTHTLPTAIVAALAGLALAAVIVLTVLWLGEARWTRVAAPILRRLPSSLEAFVRGLLHRFGAGARIVRHGRSMLLGLACAVLLWTLAGLTLSAYIAAFGLVVPWYAGFVVLLFVNFGALFPAAPGSIGVYHFLALTALTIWTADRSTALGFAVLSHAFNICLVAVLGLASLARQRLSLRAVRIDSQRFSTTHVS